MSIRRISLMAFTTVLALTVSGCDGAGDINVSATYPGMLCQPSAVFPNPPNVVYVAGRAMNDSETEGVFLCPIVTTELTRVGDVAVFALDQSSVRQVVCRVVRSEAEGTSNPMGFPTEAPTDGANGSSTGSGNATQRLQLEFSSGNLELGEYLYLRCNVPGKADESRSGIISYHVDGLR